MPLGETFNPIDSFGNQIWQPDPNPRLMAKVFLLYLAGEVKAGRVSNETVMGMLSRLREAISPPARISWDGYIPTTCTSKHKQYGLDPIPKVEIEEIKETKSSIEKWVEARGGPQKVLKAIKENQWPDTSTWGFNDRKFTVADVRFFAEIEENKIGISAAPLPVGWVDDSS